MCTQTNTHLTRTHTRTPITFPLFVSPVKQSPASAAKLPKLSHLLMGYLSPCLCVCLSVYVNDLLLSVCLSVCPPPRLPECLMFCLYVCCLCFSVRLLTVSAACLLPSVCLRLGSWIRSGCRADESSLVFVLWICHVALKGNIIACLCALDLHFVFPLFRSLPLPWPMYIANSSGSKGTC